MSEVINLRLARKARARTQAQQQAEENRARHGQTKAARQLASAETARAANALEQTRREPGDA